MTFKSGLTVPVDAMKTALRAEDLGFSLYLRDGELCARNGKHAPDDLKAAIRLHRLHLMAIVAMCEEGVDEPVEVGV